MTSSFMDLTLILFLLLAILLSGWQVYFVWFRSEGFNENFRKLGKKADQGTGIMKFLNKRFYERWKSESFIKFNLWWFRIVGTIILLSAIILLFLILFPT